MTNGCNKDDRDTSCVPNESRPLSLADRVDVVVVDHDIEHNRQLVPGHGRAIGVTGNCNR